MRGPSEIREVSVLSIDAWADGDEGWSWNAWHKVGTVALAEIVDLDDQALREWFHSNGYTTTANPALSEIDDDQYNIVICDAKDHRPVFAIAYGEAY